MEEASIFAKKYLEDLLSFFGLKIDVNVNLEEDMIQLDVPSTYLNGFLIGARSETLKALHVLTSAAVQQQANEHHRLNIDIANYKKQRAERLSRKAQVWIEEFKQEDQADKELEPMNAADRRIIHQVASSLGITTESVGEGSNRRVVLKKNLADSQEPEDLI